MILPTTAMQWCIDKVKTIQEQLEVTDVFEASEDSPGASPPYVFGYYDFEDEAKINSGGYAHNIPVNIYFHCVSASHATAAKAMEQVLLMAVAIMEVLMNSDNGEGVFLKNTNNVDEPLALSNHRLPLLMLNKSASMSQVQVRFQYLIPTPYSNYKL
jgi:hypothetical protein